jgi:hypothetical protein
MRILIISAFLLILLIAGSGFKTQLAFCDGEEAASYAEDAYDYSRKATYSDTLDDAQYYAHKAMAAAEDAESEASDSELDDAASSASDAYDYAKKAYYSDTLEDAQYYSEKAKSAAEDAQSAAEDSE